MPGRRYVMVQEETEFGVMPDPFTPDLILSYTDLDVNPDNGTLYVEESMNRERTNALPGPFTESGTLSLLPRPDTVGKFLKWGMGTESPAGTFKVGTSIKSFTMVEIRGDLPTLEARVILGCCVKTVTLEAPARDICTFDVEILSANEKLVAVSTFESITPTVSTERPFYFADGAILYNSNPAANLESFKFAFENTIADDHHEIGSRFLPSIELEKLSMNGEADAKFKNWNWRKELYGPSTPTEPGTEPNPKAMSFTLTSGTKGMVITCPAVIITENPAPVKAQDRLTQKISYEVIYNSGTQIVVDNT